MIEREINRYLFLFPIIIIPIIPHLTFYLDFPPTIDPRESFAYHTREYPSPPPSPIKISIHKLPRFLHSPSNFQFHFNISFHTFPARSDSSIPPRCSVILSSKRNNTNNREEKKDPKKDLFLFPRRGAFVERRVVPEEATTCSRFDGISLSLSHASHPPTRTEGKKEGRK